jgi:hypothetical protein
MLGEGEWRFITGENFHGARTKLRCFGYPVLRDGAEVGFAGRLNGIWVAVRDGRATGFKTRHEAVESLLSFRELHCRPSQGDDNIHTL